MKNFLFLLTIATLSLSSCKDQKTTTKKVITSSISEISKAEKFVIDSIQISDSLKITDYLTAEFTSNLLVFPTITNKTLLDSIYQPEHIRLDDYSKATIKHGLEDKMKKYFEQQKNLIAGWSPTFKQTWMSNSNMALHSKEFDYMTINYFGDGYSGGAHGYHYLIYKVFDLKTNKVVQLSDILSETNPSIWNRILSDNFFKNDKDNGQAEMLLVKKIPLNNNFYFDKKFLYFVYNEYEITAYAAGTVVIKVPLSDIRPFLQTAFKTRLAL